MKMTKEQKYKNYKNHKKAREYFGIEGEKNLVLHHIDWTLRHNNIERYIEWNPEDLVVMTKSEHRKLHNELQGNPFSFPEVIKKISDTYKERYADKPRGTLCNMSDEDWHKMQTKAVSNRNKTCWKNQEYRDHMREAVRKGCGKPVYCVTLDKSFICLKDAMDYTGLTKYYITISADKGKPSKGLLFEWIDKGDTA